MPDEVRISPKDYDEIHAVVCEKSAIKEMMDALKVQMARAISREEKWWAKQVQKHDLDLTDHVFSVNHQTKTIVSRPKPKQADNVTPIK